jgi:hypothetical protein
VKGIVSLSKIVPEIARNGKETLKEKQQCRSIKGDFSD